MTVGGHGTELAVVVVVFGLVTVLGFAASRWRRPESVFEEKWGLEEWGLGGRAFGNGVSFFLLGGDIYTAYTLVALPALVYGLGAAGYFPVAFLAVTYPLIYVALPRMWSVAHVHGFVTPAEFVRARFGSSALAVLVACTTIVATMPYIALQLVGLRAVFEAMGIGGDLPLALAFGLLAFFTFNSGLRAPALIAVVKDLMLMATVLVVVLLLTITQGGWGHVFAVAGAQFARSGGGSLLLPPGAQLSYVTLALGSAMALFLYPHTLTGVLAARNRATIQRSLSTLPVYTLMLGVFALFGFAAIASGVHPAGSNPTTILPQLLQANLNGWGAGMCFAALSVGALVPASIMSIGAANLFTRNIYRVFIRPDATSGQETQVSRTASLIVKLGALAVIIWITPGNAIDLQLMGGVVLLQVFPAVALGLFTNWFHRAALITGLLAGLASGILMLYQIPGTDPGGKVISRHFGGDSWPLAHLGLPTNVTIYAGILALAVNLAVATTGTWLCRRLGILPGTDETHPSDYTADEHDPTTRRMAELIDGVPRRHAKHARRRHLALP
ncbi:MAG TPA: sodium:solute symporter [Streptosporangiaceae bacterium]|nr:sodium:solute symporter [Streptosporangiaceae bacterium]